MNIIDIIAKKRDKKELSKEEISYFIKSYTNGETTDYQAAALIMAIYLNGMNDKEITNLTLEMAHSGEVLDLSEIGIVVDKHSTGGVGDKITLILMPIIASLGIPVAKMSGRGLGFTGGTADKLESIPGYIVNTEIDKFIQNIKSIGISLIAQTLDLAPADKKIYALRDTIGCTNSIPLIASSIMSKKIASGANKIVLDVTCGSGAFMKNEEDAIKLSNTMKNIGKLVNKETICVITNMDEPLGYAIGNNIEVIEAINCLKGNMPQDVKEVTLELGAYIMKLAGKGDNIEENKQKIEDVINNGKAYSKFLELVKNQGGDIRYIENTEMFEKANYEVEVTSSKQGFISKIDAEIIGKVSCKLGAGRVKKEDKIDMTAGIILNKKVGDYIEKGEKILTLYSNNLNKIEEVKEEVYKSIEINKERIKRKNTILRII